MSLKFKIGALTDVGLVRTNNEDNFLTIPDLTVTGTGSDSSRIYDLGAKGALMVVADGMGGMNAGEIASEIAINAIKDSFSPMRITPDVLKNSQSIVRFMDEAIADADAKIKAAAMRNPATQGMGTTIVIAWILAGKLYVSWCGDSRAYVFNSVGLHQITKDHSYVQQVVDAGQITREQAFDYPQSNVITRSLCDGADIAEPDSLFQPYPLANGDTIILCTDGVCGMLRDNELQDVIGSSPDDLDSLMASIKAAVYKTGASDNMTMCIAQVVDGALPEPQAAYFQTTEAMLEGKMPSAAKATKAASSSGKMPWRLIAIVGIVAVVVAVAATLIFGGDDNDKEKNAKETTQTEAPAAEEGTPAASSQQPVRPVKTTKPTNSSKPQTSNTATDAQKQEEESGILDALNTVNQGKTDTAASSKPTTPSAVNAISGAGKTTPPSPKGETSEPKTPQPTLPPVSSGE